MIYNYKSRQGRRIVDHLNIEISLQKPEKTQCENCKGRSDRSGSGHFFGERFDALGDVDLGVSNGGSFVFSDGPRIRSQLDENPVGDGANSRGFTGVTRNWILNGVSRAKDVEQIMTVLVGRQFFVVKIKVVEVDLDHSPRIIRLDEPLAEGGICMRVWVTAERNVTLFLSVDDSTRLIREGSRAGECLTAFSSESVSTRARTILIHRASILALNGAFLGTIELDVDVSGDVVLRLVDVSDLPQNLEACLVSNAVRA